MSMIPDEVIEQVRDAADLIQLIGEHVELKRTGADYRGPCPFHGGAHRNFAVIPKKGMFYCFVCHAAGDVFSFYMKKLGMDYPTAVRSVAGRVGITIPERAGALAVDDAQVCAIRHDGIVERPVEFGFGLFETESTQHDLGGHIGRDRPFPGRHTAVCSSSRTIWLISFPSARPLNWGMTAFITAPTSLAPV